jgi:hypothetical protein
MRHQLLLVQVNGNGKEEKREAEKLSEHFSSFRLNSDLFDDENVISIYYS